MATMLRQATAREAQRLLDSGLSRAEIAAAMGYSKSYITAVIRDPDATVRNAKLREACTQRHCADCGVALPIQRGNAKRCPACRRAIHAARERTRHRLNPVTARLRDHAKRGVPSTHESIAPLVGDPCAYCGEASGHGIDHIVPTHHGGDSEWENLTACCARCNSRKNDMPLLIFLARRLDHG